MFGPDGFVILMVLYNKYYNLAISPPRKRELYTPLYG